MGPVKSFDGKLVTEELIDKVEAALERDEWPEGWAFSEPVVEGAPPTPGRPPLSAEGSSVLSVKIPKSMKTAVERRAKDEGVSTSEFVRTALTNELLAKTA